MGMGLKRLASSVALAACLSASILPAQSPTDASLIDGTLAVVSPPDRFLEYVRLLDPHIEGKDFDPGWISMDRANTVIVFVPSLEGANAVPERYRKLFLDMKSLRGARHYTVPHNAAMNKGDQNIQFVVMDRYAALFHDQVNVDPEQFNVSYVFVCILASSVIREAAEINAATNLFQNARDCGRFF
jgi:hypothetical protein